MTGDSADERILFINLGIFRYGTDDKIQAAAIFLSIVLLIIIAFVIFGAQGQGSVWNDKVFAWLTGAFLFVSGVALGKGGSNGFKSED